MSAEQVQGCQIYLQAAELPLDYALSGHGFCSHAWPVLNSFSDSGVGEGAAQSSLSQGRWIQPCNSTELRQLLSVVGCIHSPSRVSHMPASVACTAGPQMLLQPRS